MLFRLSYRRAEGPRHFSVLRAAKYKTLPGFHSLVLITFLRQYIVAIEEEVLSDKELVSLVVEKVRLKFRLATNIFHRLRYHRRLLFCYNRLPQFVLLYPTPPPPPPICFVITDSPNLFCYNRLPQFVLLYPTPPPPPICFVITDSPNLFCYNRLPQFVLL